MATLSGNVFAAATQAPIAGADVTVALLKRATQTDRGGNFVLRDLPPGAYDVTVRKVGYSPTDFRVEVAQGANLKHDITLLGIRTLDSVVVGESKTAALGDVATSRKLSRGVIVDRAELEEKKGRTIASILRDKPGLQVIQGRGTISYLISKRVIIGGPILDEDRRMGAPDGLCYATVYIDGIRVYTNRPPQPLFNLGILEPEQIEAIELYAGASEVPSRYSALDATCGLMVVHTRKPTNTP